MALYRNTGNNRSRSSSQMAGAQSAMGSMSKENQTTEYEPGRMTPMQGMGQAISFMSLPGQLKGVYDNGKDFLNWGMEMLGAPNAQGQVLEAGTGAANLAGGAQMNTGAQVANAGAEAAASLQDQMYAVPEYLGGDPALAEQAATTASQIVPGGESVAETGASLTGNTANSTAAQTATKASQGGMSTMGATLAPTGGGIVGGLAGKELGRALGGQTGADIGGVVGSMGGAYLGSLAGASLAGGGAAAGAAAGATAGSAVPGLGTVIGAGIGALTSFFL